MNDTPFIAFIIAFITALSVMLTYVITMDTFEVKAIENGCAQYNPQTAEFEWLNPVD